MLILPDFLLITNDRLGKLSPSGAHRQQSRESHLAKAEGNVFQKDMQR
jgi:hypothetical protein